MRTVAWLVALLLWTLVAGCDSGTSPDSGSATQDGGSGRRFAVSYQTVDNPFFSALTKGLRSVIETQGDTLQVYDASFDARIQTQQVSDMIQAQLDGVFLNPVNWKGIGRSLQQAKASNLPVIVVDAPVQDRNLVVTTVASDNFAAGKLAGEAFCKKHPESAKVALLTLPVNKACRDRISGFKAALEGKAQYTIVAEQHVGKGTTEAAHPLMQDILQRTPDLDAVFAINDPAALGCLRALEQAGKADDVTVLAVDGHAKAIEEVARGRMLGTSAQFPEEIGAAAAKAMYRHLEGQTVEPDIKIRVELIDSSNVQRFAKSGD